MKKGFRSTIWSSVITATLYVPGHLEAAARAASIDGKTSVFCRQQMSKSDHFAKL